jgi:hypothetical protein
MSERQLYDSRPFDSQLAPLAIRIGGISAGLAIGGKNGFRFLAAHPRFDLLDGSLFRRLEDLRAAAKRLNKAAAAPLNASAGPPAAVPGKAFAQQSYGIQSIGKQPKPAVIADAVRNAVSRPANGLY